MQLLLGYMHAHGLDMSINITHPDADLSLGLLLMTAQ